MQQNVLYLLKNPRVLPPDCTRFKRV